MNYRNGLKMNFPVKELIAKLKTNREEHAEIVTEAKKFYLTALAEELKEKLARLESGEKIKPNSKLPVPGDNLEEYDTAISMLEFTTDKQIELTQDQYHCYVEDEWEWQKNFLETAANYSQAAREKARVYTMR